MHRFERLVDDLTAFFWEVVIPITIIGGLLVSTLGVGTMALAYYSCKSKTTAMKLTSSWGPMQGCIVETQDGPTTLEAYLNRTVPQNVRIK